jgi:hypothetical protein
MLTSRLNWFCPCSTYVMKLLYGMAVPVQITGTTVHEHVMTVYVGVEIQVHPFLTSVLDGGERSVSRPGRFTSGKEPSVPVE